MPEKPARYIGKKPEEVNIDDPVGADLGVNETQKLTPEDIDFLNKVPAGLQIVPRDPASYNRILKLQALGKVGIKKVGLTASEYYYKIS